jgi:hypothetical protein
MHMIRSCASGTSGYGGGLMFTPSFHAHTLRQTVPHLQPAVAWQFKRSYDNADALAKMGCRELIEGFVYYPDDIAPRHPREVMQRVLEDHRKGMHVCRSDYRDKDDIVTQLFLQTEKPTGPAWFLPEAGSFRIAGLGTIWARGAGQNKRKPDYGRENVVRVAPNVPGGTARRLYFEQPGKGMMLVGADLSDFHNGRTNFGIRATRHVGVDYTGAGGAPGIFAVVDSVSGGGDKCWTMHTEGSPTATADGFTIAGREAGTSLQGHVIAPADATVAISNRTIRVSSSAERVDFFVVMTLQRGAAPNLAVAGEGLNATVTTGRRHVRFIDGHLVFEETD